LKLAEFTPPAGHLVPAIGKQSAFVPSPLPPEKTVFNANDAKDKLGVTYAAARSLIDKLGKDGILASVPNTYPQLSYAPAIRQAARPAAHASPAAAPSDQV
jgi:hypothetical protein